MKTGLIGYTGFVGSTLHAAMRPDDVFRSTDIASIRGREYGHLVCAGVQAVKWWANANPAEDLAGIDRLLDALDGVRAGRFTLVSTVDVYADPRGVDERSPAGGAGHHAYGLHRLHVEDRVRERFPRVLILRLPGLFGPGLKKNVLYDLIHRNQLDQIHPGGTYQYYDTRRLAADVEKAWALGIGLLNVSCEPVPTSVIRDRFFPDAELGRGGPPPPGYDMRSVHAAAWGGSDGYLYSRDQVLRDFASWLAEAGHHRGGA